ncbi:MAG TPA: mannonate dehydratase [Rhizomicrobium sp.]|jgi:mannonate dehydratase|nr:mannonate dehydratase [Rhizomicrobium sp.]
MHTKRQFAKALVSAATGLTAAGSAARAAVPRAALPRDAAYRVFPDLPVRRNDKIRSGGDYHTVVGKNGFTSPESLNYFRRFNARWLTAAARDTGVVKNPKSLGGGAEMTAEGAWDLDRMKQMQDDCQRAGMTLECIRMSSAYIMMKPGPERERFLDVLRENIRKVHQAGCTLISYHWTMIPIMRNFNVPGRGGSTYVGFKLEPNWKQLPVYRRSGRVSSDDYWERIDTFLKAVIPVCKENRVKLACHPYDPGGMPLGYLGVDNWDAVDYAAALKKYVMLYDDPANGLTYDCGVAGESLPDPNTEIVIMRWLAERKKINQVHFRNVRGHLHNFLEVYEDEGDCPMFNCLKVLRDTGWEGTLLPDHNPVNPDDPGKLQAFAFSYGYIEGLLRAAREESIRATSA